MVFKEVEIVRGVLITREEMMQMMKDYFRGFSEERERARKEGKDDFNEIVFINEMILNINDNLDKPLSLQRLNPCCARNENAFLLGAMLTAYPRARFSIDDVAPEDREAVAKWRESKKNVACCAKVLKESTLREEGVLRCGDLWVCDACVGKTSNGSYPVDEIAAKTVECTNYCFRCNTDKCAFDAAGKPHPGSSTITIDEFIDEIICEACSIFEEDEEKLETRIKNYYKVDDCLSCS